MNKIKVAKATINGRESLFLITLDKNGKKINMTMAQLDDDGMTEVIVADNGFIISKDELGYETYEIDNKDQRVWGDIHNLPNFTFLLNTHSCLATNKQILLKDEIKQIKLRIEDNGY